MPIGESPRLSHPKKFVRKRFKIVFGKKLRFLVGIRLYLCFELDKFLDMMQEPRVNFSQLVRFFDGKALLKTSFEIKNPLWMRGCQHLLNFFGRTLFFFVPNKTGETRFGGEKPFSQRFFEIPPKSQSLPHRFH